MTNKKLIYNIIWLGSLFTKAVYGYLAYNRYRTSEIVSEEVQIISILFLVLGIIDAIAGILIVKNTFKRDSKIVPLYKRFTSKSVNPESIDPHFSLFTVGLGLIETSSLFGLVGYLTTNDIRLFFILVTVGIIAWIFAKPDTSSLID